MVSNEHIVRIAYISLFAIIGIPCTIMLFFWLLFIIYRIRDLIKKYNKLRLYSKLYPDSYLKFFNCKVKLILYSFFFFLLISELMSAFGFCLGSLLHINYSPIPSKNLNHIPLNCTNDIIEVWEAELADPSVAVSYAFNHTSLCMIGIMLVGLLKFIFLAYQNERNFKDVKFFVITNLFFLPIIFALCVIPQTQIISKLLTPIYPCILFFLILKHRKQYILILKWRCDDAQLAQDEISYRYHSKIKSNSLISFNIITMGFFIFLISNILSMFPSLFPMLLTDKSKYVMRAYNMDLNLAFLTCPIQQIIYNARITIDNLVPFIVLLGTVVYTMPIFVVSIGVLIHYVSPNYSRVALNFIRPGGII